MRFLFIPAYLLLFLILFRDWIFQWNTSILGNPDGDGGLTIWIAYWPYLKFQSFFSGEILSTYINSNIFSGFERGYSFSEMMPGIMPLVMLLDLAFHNPILTINILQFTFIILLAISNYLLLNYFEIGKSASFLSALFCSLTAFHIQNFFHFQMQFAFVLPIGILFLLKFLQTKKILQLLLLYTSWIFLAANSSHIFIYLTLLSALILILYIYLLVKLKSIEAIFIEIKTFPIFQSIVLTIFSFTIVLYLLFPFMQNLSEFHWKRTKAETLLFAVSPSDWKKIGLDPIFFLLLISILGLIFYSGLYRNFLLAKSRSYTFLQVSTVKISAFSVGIFFALLFFLFSLGPREFYPYNLLYNFFFGFSGIRDISRILYCFWIFSSIPIAIALQIYVDAPVSERSLRYIKKVIFFLCIGIEIVFINARVYKPFRLDPTKNLQKIHTEYARNYESPLLVFSSNKTLIGSIAIDAYSQYLSIFHKKELVGGYSGFYPQSIFMLRYALSSFKENPAIWKENEIESLLQSSPARAVAYVDTGSIYSVSKNIQKLYPTCTKKLIGQWRNLEQISPRYGLVIGFTPNSEFCIGKYSVISDRKLQVVWKINDKIIYKDELYFTTPFYSHPYAPELLYGLEAFRDKGNYILEIYEKEELLYVGKVRVM